MIRKMCDMAKRLTDCVESQINNGLENVNTQELSEAVDMIKDLNEAIYYASVYDAMQNEDSEVMYYRGQPRNKMGQFKADGRPNKYYNPVTMPATMSADMYSDRTDRMYTGDTRYLHNDMYDSRMGKAKDSRVHYYEKKDMDSMEKYVDDLADDIKEMIKDATPEVRTIAKKKIQNLINTM